MSQSKRTFSLNVIDGSLLLLVVFCLLGNLTASSGHAGVNKVIEGCPRVNIEVYISGMKTKDLNLFQVGDKSSLTIRNQPVEPPLLITAVKSNQKEMAFFDGKKVVAVPDPANAIAHDFYVTVSCDAEETKDGYVIRGNKIKIGNQVELEGRKYRIQGMVVDIQSVSQP